MAYTERYERGARAHSGPGRTQYGPGRVYWRPSRWPVVNLRPRPFEGREDEIFRPNRADGFPLFKVENILSFKVFAGIGFSLDAPGAGGTRPGAHNRVSHSTQIFYATHHEKGATK